MVKIIHSNFELNKQKIELFHYEKAPTSPTYRDLYRT